jgi:magnesium transporter
MKELESKPIPQLENHSSANLDLFQKRWFCVALYPSGKTFKQDAESPVPFLEVLSRSSIAWVDYITDDVYRDIGLTAAQLGFSDTLISSISRDSPLSYQDFDTEMWMKIPSIQIRGMDVMVLPLVLFIRKNVVFTLHASLVDKRFIRLRRYSDTILRKISTIENAQDMLTSLLARIIDANNDSNFRHLRVIEERGDDLNQDLMNTNTPRDRLGPKIYEMKHALISYMNSLWDSVDVIHALRYGDAELITDDPKILDILSVMADEVKGQIGLAEHMSEVLASGLEVMQSIYNNQLQALNNRMAMVMTYLTIVGTAVLVPNTLATFMGSSAFNLQPDDLWWYFLLMFITTIGATYAVYWWIKKRGWLPKKAE